MIRNSSWKKKENRPNIFQIYFNKKTNKSFRSKKKRNKIFTISSTKRYKSHKGIQKKNKTIKKKSFIFGSSTLFIILPEWPEDPEDHIFIITSPGPPEHAIKSLCIAPLEETNVTRSKIMYDVNLVISLARLYLLQVLPFGRGLHSTRVKNKVHVHDMISNKYLSFLLSLSHSRVIFQAHTITHALSLAGHALALFGMILLSKITLIVGDLCLLDPRHYLVSRIYIISHKNRLVSIAVLLYVSPRLSRGWIIESDLYSWKDKWMDDDHENKKLNFSMERKRILIKKNMNSS